MPKGKIKLEAVKTYWSTAEVANILNINASSVRWWTKRYTVPHKRSRDQNRSFGREGIEMLRTVWYLRNIERYTIGGAQRQIWVDYPKWKQIANDGFIF